MSNTLFLDALKKYNLQHYYPSLYSQGLSTLDFLAQLSMQDCTKIGIRSIDDKQRFMALAEDIKQQLKAKSQPQPPKRPVSATSPQSRKRPALSKIEKTTPERNARRMTLAPQTLPRSTSPKSTVRTANVSSRRLSFLPRPPTNKSPIRPTVKTNPVSPSTQKTPPKLPKHLEELGVEVKMEEAPQLQKQPARLLDAYGIPVTPPKRRLSGDASQSGPLLSFEEYVRQRANSRVVAAAAASPSNSDLHQRIRVCVRKRPLSKKETAAGEHDVAPVAGIRTIQVNAPKTKVDLTPFTEQHSFTFDDVFDSNATNIDVYRRTALPLVEYIFSGGKATCFAYGQTGSGKTYTMLDPSHGLYVQAAQDIFTLLNQPEYSHLSAWVGFYEIYQNQLYDLLNSRKKLVPREDGNSNVVIAGLKEYRIKDVEGLMQIFEYGSQARTTGKTGANNTSSRSHAILQVLLKRTTDSGMHGKITFIDLAGSERGADRGEANTKTRMEGAEINKSLLALKECIRALDQDKRHTPFRGSKLTQVLRDSFVGNSRSCMIATISPNSANSEHTLNTLRYADRVKELKGETDRRLMGEQRTEAGLSALAANEPSIFNSNPSADMEDEVYSNTNSEPGWDEEQTENLLDIDFPSQVSAQALGTPQPHSKWAGSQSEQNNSLGTNDVIPATTPQRQENYMRRLSSPPDEVYRTPLEDPFKSSPLSPRKTPATPGTPKTPEMKQPNLAEQVSVKHIRDFIKLHRAQIKELEECIKHEKKMISKLSLNVSSRHDFQEDGENDQDHEETVQLYEDYLNDLEDVLERKVACVETLRERVKAELGDEEADN